MNQPGVTLPGQFERRVLLVTAGMSPAVVTETIWALANLKDSFLPTEIHCVTTLQGKQRLTEAFVDGSHLRDLWVELDDAEGPVPKLEIHVVTRGGRGLADIQIKEDNEALADLTTDLIRSFTDDAGSALHVSIAGGRKTMTFLGGYILSLFARPQDRLSHVLVDPRFEIPGFFYPPKVPEKILSRIGEEISTSDAGITLADIPIVRLRSFLKSNPIAGDLSYSQVVQYAQKMIDPPSMIVDVPNRRLICQDIEVPFGKSDTAFALTLYLAQRVLEEGGYFEAALTYEEFCDPREQSDFQKAQALVARDIFALDDLKAKHEANAFEPLTSNAFQTNKNRIKSRIGEHLAGLAGRYEVKSIRKGAQTAHGFELSPANIQIVKGEET